MKAIKSDGRYMIYSDGIETFDQLPPRAFRVMHSEQTGFFLVGADDIRNTEKVYGGLNQKADRVFNTYRMSTRSIGVLMSGTKGIGKTMMSRILCEKANEMGLPIIIVSFNKAGISDFLGKINQPALILFDEFEKMFSGLGHAAGDQPDFLSLLDGLYSSKWLFVFTCNHLEAISEYMLGRPGRVHYHFRFQMPTKQEIREYLEDNIPEDKYDQIPEVIAFARAATINYDALRAIAFEFKIGGDFRDFIKDLNIEQPNKRKNCNVYLEFNNGVIMFNGNKTVDLIGGTDQEEINMGGFSDADSSYGGGYKMIELTYDERNIRVSEADDEDGVFYIAPDKLSECEVDNACAGDAMNDEVRKCIKSGVKRIMFIITDVEYKDIQEKMKSSVIRYHEDKQYDGEGRLVSRTRHLVAPGTTKKSESEDEEIQNGGIPKDRVAVEAVPTPSFRIPHILGEDFIPLERGIS